MAKTYILVFDREGGDVLFLKLQRMIKESAEIKRWWHHLKSCYILQSDATAEELADQISRVLGDNSFLLSEVNLENSNGWLPRKAWDWIIDASGGTREMAG